MDEKKALHTNLRPHLQVWKKILSLLDEIVHTAGNDRISEKSFLSIFEDGLAALTYSTIPPTLDHVTVTGMDRGYAMEAPVVFIPGAGEGEFPRRVEEGGFFTELERQKIYRDSRLIFGESLLQEVHKEQFFTYLALTRARKALYITLPSVNDDHNDTEPSFLISQLRRLGYASESRTLSPEDWEKTAPISPIPPRPSPFCHPFSVKNPRQQLPLGSPCEMGQGQGLWKGRRQSPFRLPV